MHSTIMARIFHLLILAALALSGCGERDDSPRQGSRPEAPGEGSVSVTEPAPPPDEAAKPPPSEKVPAEPPPAPEEDGPPPDAETTAPPDAPPEENASTETEFEERFRRVLELEADAQFHEAMRRCRELRKEFRSEAAANTLGRKLNELAQFARRSRNLPFAIRKLSSESAYLERKVAREKLVEAGELGRLYLRKAVRDRAGDGIANEAAEILIFEAGPDCVPFLVEQLAPPPEQPLLDTMVKGIVRNAERPPLDSLLAAVEFRHSPAAEEYREVLLDMLRDATERELEPGDLAPLFAKTADDDAFEQRHVVELLAFLYDGATGRDDEQFDALLRGEGRLQDLRDYAERAANAENETLAAWGDRMTRALSRIDYRALGRGLVAWWTFDEVADGILADVSGHNRPAETIGGKGPDPAGGRIGACLRFKTERDSFVQSKKTRQGVFGTLHRRSHSFAAWIRPDGLPDGEQPDPWWAIVMKEGWHQGLRLTEPGRANHHHYHGDQVGNSASSDAPVPTDAWTHVVGAVDQEKGTIRLFLNGELESEVTMPGGGGWWNRHDGHPVRVGAAREARRHDWACRYNGRIDEVAVYSRALTEVDAGHLYRIRTPEQRAALRKKSDIQ